MKKSYQFQFSRNADNDFESLEKSLQVRVLKKLDFFEHSEDPLSFAKKLQGLENRYSFRIGDYRVIVSKKDQGILIILVVVKIGHRKEVYES